MVCTNCVCSGAQRAPCRPAVLAASILWHKAAGFVIARRRGDKNGGILHEKSDPDFTGRISLPACRFSAVCEYRQQHPEPEELWLSFDANSAYRFRNAKGETLEYDDLDFSGDMQIIDSVLGGVDTSPYFYLTLLYSKRLEADFVDGGPDAYVRVSTDLALWGVEGSGVQRAVFTGSGIETTGENMDYTVRACVVDDLYLEATGSGESHIRCVQRGGKLYLTAQDAALTVKIESYLETEPLDSMALSAGETCTIRIRDDGMEFVR